MSWFGVIVQNKSAHLLFAVATWIIDGSQWKLEKLLLIYSAFHWNRNSFWVLLSFAEILNFPGDRLVLLPSVHTSQTLSFHNNLPYPPFSPSYFAYPDWESVILCKYQHYPTLDTFHSDTLPEYLPYPTNRRKIPLPTTRIYPNYPSLHFPTLYYCHGLIKYKAETIYQIRPKRPRTETTQAETTKAETTQGRNDSGLKWLRAETNDPRMQLRL